MHTPDNPLKDMRSKVRIDVRRPVQILDQQTGEVLGTLVNYSDDGMMILGTTHIHENRIFQVELVLADNPDSRIELGIESLWSQTNREQNMFWTGFYIIDIAPDNRHRLVSLLG